MNTTHLLSPRLRQLVLAHACALLAAPLASAQQTTAANSAQLAQDAQALAKYDKNKNGKLDADEVTAQQADQAKDASAAVEGRSSSGDVVTMSPFEVVADDKGYSASNTMAGTRLNSKLEDIAGSVSVVTKQQLLDTAALDLNDIFLYEVGTEGTGQFTDLTNDGRGDYDNVAGNPTGANRMRGLSQANITVGGFNSSSTIPLDTYNINALEIARGPNSSLAGLGEAGGTVNVVTSGANLSRETSNIQARADSYGGFRTSIDINRPIFQNKLALRLSAVYNETGYVRKPSVDRTNRQQIALTFRPFKTTTLTASYEGFHEFAQRANSITPKDTVSVWKRNGSPTYNAFTPNANGIGTVPTFTVTDPVTGVKTTTTITNINQLPPGLVGIGSANVRILQYIDQGQIAFLMHGANFANAALGTTTLQQFVQSTADAVAGPLYKIRGTTDKSFYDWTDVNLAASGYQIQRATIANLSLDQGIINTPRNRIDLNLAWRREDQYDYRRMFIGQQDGVGTTIAVDANEKLVDGRPNPFFQRPFIGGVNPQVFVKPTFADAYRAQLAYQLDLRREDNFLKWLGLHRLIGYREYTMNITTANGNGLRYHDMVIDNPDFNPALLALTPTTNITGNAAALLYPLYYFGATKGGGIEYANTGPVKPNGKFLASFANATSTQYNLADPVTLQETYFALGNQKKKIRTAGGSIQSFFFDGQLVTTFGLRRDTNNTQDNFPLTVGGLAGGLIDRTNLYNFGVNKRWRSGDTSTKGAVARPFRSLPFLKSMQQSEGVPRFFAEVMRGFSVKYNRSDSFKPADTAYNLYLQELPNPSGNTKEYGFGLSMYDNKFTLQLTHQETLQIHTRAGTSTIATRALGIDFDNSGQNLSFGLFDLATSWQQQIHPEFTLGQAATIAATQIGYSVDYILSVNGKSIGDANDALSKGWELEMQFNPTKYWTVKATGNQQEAIDSNISLFLQQFVDQRMPFWTSLRIPTDTLPGGGQLPNAGALWWSTAQGSNGQPQNYFATNVQVPLSLAITTQGKSKPQVRQYTFNAITNYRLAGLTGILGENSWLRNAEVGGAVRWASKGAVGYLAGVPDSDGILRKLDGNKPFYDKATTNFDLLLKYNTKLFNNRIRASFQFNVRNITESGHLQGVAINPDGQYWQYRIIDPRQFIFSSSFDL